MNPFRKWLYVKAFNTVARIAPQDVRKVHHEVFTRGMKAYEDARRITVPLRADLLDAGEDQ